MPSKIPTFSWSDPERMKKATVLGPSEEFLKNLRTAVVLCLGYIRSQLKKVHLILIPAVPQPKNQKKCSFWLFRHRFQPNGWSTAGFKMSCTFAGLSFSPDAELKDYVSVFEKSAYGLRFRGFFVGLSRHNKKNWFVF